MTKIKLSGLITAMSGKLGGSILSNTISGTTLKQNSFSQQHPSSAQQIQRTKIYEVNKRWKDTSPSDKANWTAEAVNYPFINNLGDTAYYTGYQLFCKLNVGRVACGQSVSLGVTTFGIPTQGEADRLTSIGGNLSYFVQNATIGTFIRVFMTKSFPYGVKPKLSDFRYIDTSEIFGANSGKAYTTKYQAIFGIPVIGSYIYVYHVVIDPSSGMSADKSNIVNKQRLT